MKHPSEVDNSPQIQDDASPPSLWRPFLVSLVLFLLLAMVVLWNWRILMIREERDVQEHFALDVEAIGQRVRERMLAYEIVLRGAAGAFSAPDAEITYAQWQDMTSRLQVADIYPGISSIAWSRNVQDHQLEDFIARNRRDGRPDFSVFPSGQRERYQIIEYIAPVNDRSRRVIGFDLLTDAERNMSVQQVIDEARPALGAPMSLYGNNDQEGPPEDIEQTGVLLYFPVYQSATPPPTLEERRAMLVGMTNAAFRGQELVEGLFGAQLRLFHIKALDLQTGRMVFDGMPPQITSGEDQTPSDAAPRFHARLEIPLYGRIWSLDITATAEYERGLIAGRSHNFSLILGLIVSLLLSMLASSFIHHRDHERYVNARKAMRLRKEAERLAAANRYKSEFLANMSHELRTPLNSILILSDQLRQNSNGNLDEKQIRHADIVYRSGNDLLMLINDVLDLAKIEAEKMQLTLEPVHLQTLLSELEASMSPLATTKGIDLQIASLEAESGLPCWVQTDRGKLHQILRNLMSNAIKFTDEGQVRVLIKGDKTLEDGRMMLHFIVRDTGIGIDSHHQEHIFEAFIQIDGSTSRRFGGTGLGLSITKHLVEMLEGEIELQTIKGLGSTFIVKLPCHLAEPPSQDQPASPEKPEIPAATIARQSANHSSALKEHRLLLVDDDVRNIYAMTALLDELGVEIVTASNGEEAIDRALHLSPDLVLMDMSMPIMDGYTATTLLKTKHAFPRPIIAMTAHAMVEDRKKCIVSGCDDYIAKPVNREELYACLERWLAPDKQTIRKG